MNDLEALAAEIRRRIEEKKAKEKRLPTVEKPRKPKQEKHKK